MRSLALLLAATLLAVSACSDDDGGANNSTGNANNNNGAQPSCGDGRIDPGEACDDGAQNDDTLPNACRTSCRLPSCGDGVVDSGETCDDGNDRNDDGCLTACSGAADCCVPNVCGDGFVNGLPHGDGDPVESCDDGNTADGDDCRGDCRQDMTRCGDGQVDPGEGCDQGTANSNTAPDACRLDCQAARCGDGVRDSAEGCDCGTDPGVLPVSCPDVNGGPSATCTATCARIASCGDGVLDPGEQCDEGAANSDTAPDACRLDCTNPWCGDGVVDSVEECEGTDVGAATCVSQGFDLGVLGCNAGACAFDTSGCQSCLPGETACPGVGCVDLLSDPGNCFSCGMACGVDGLCVAGSCRSASVAWTPVGDPVLTGASFVADLDLVEMAGEAAVGYAGDEGVGAVVRVRRKDPSSSLWYNVGPEVSSTYTNVQDAVALARDDTYLYAVFAESDNPPPENIHVVRRQMTDLLGAWTTYGSPGFASACASQQGLDLAVSGGVIHVVTLGSVGCGLGVDYAWFENAFGWRQRPSATSFPGQLTSNSNGRPSLAVTDRAWVAVSDNVGGTSSLQVLSWDALAARWVDLWGPIDQTAGNGWGEDLALVSAADGTLYVAWVEASVNNGQGDRLYVGRLDPTAGTWALVGSGSVDPAAVARAPSLALIGGRPWVAYLDETGGVAQARVRTLNAFDSWIAVGGALNVNPAAVATHPVIAPVAGFPTVAWVEGWNSIHVKAFR